MQILFSVTESLNELCAWICGIVYQLIAKIYEIFFEIAEVNILTKDDLSGLYNRVTMILTIIMTFYIVFELVKYVIEPDKISDKESGAGKIATKIMIVIVLIAFVPTIFTIAFDFQKRILENDIISKIVLGTSQEKASVDKQGRIFSSNVLRVFYYVDPDAGMDDSGVSEDCGGMTCENIVNSNLSGLATNGEIPYMNKGLTETNSITVDNEKVEMYKIHFDGFIAVAVGVFMVYILVLYCVDVGKRWVQLIFLQIISPIPIISYLSPKKDGMFQKWCKQCLTTYLDLFIRIVLIYFVLVICRILTNADLGFAKNSGWVYVFIVLGLLMFAQNAPKLLQELFPSMGAASGNFGLKAGDRVAPMAARAIGAGLGATALVKSALARGVNTARRNRENRDKREDALNAFNEAQKGYDAARQQSKRNINAAKTKYRDLKNRGASKEQLKAAKDQMKADKAADAKEVRAAKLNRDGKQADYKNKAYKSIAGNALSGALSGGMQGMKAGFGATKLEDIGKKVSEGYKNTQSSIDAREKWLDAGGGSTVDRIITGAAQKVGISTAANRIEAEVKQLEGQAKAQEALATVEADVKTKGDGAEDRLKDKIGELKLKPRDGAKIKTGLVGSDGKEMYAEFGKSDTLATIDRKYKAKAAAAKSASDAATKKYQELQEQGASQEKLAQAREESERLAMEAQNAEFASTQITKNAAREEFTQILNKENPQEEKDFDQVAVQKVLDLKKSIEVARSNPSTIAELKKIALDKDDKFTEEDFNAFMTGKFEDFDQFDRVKVRLINISNERKRQAELIKEQQRKLQASSATDAAKANEGYYGGNK